MILLAFVPGLSLHRVLTHAAFLQKKCNGSAYALADKPSSLFHTGRDRGLRADSSNPKENVHCSQNHEDAHYPPCSGHPALRWQFEKHVVCLVKKICMQISWPPLGNRPSHAQLAATIEAAHASP
eukprot:TRINITY_DN45263_c0_g1_i1.p2 TRINITY_DN45263_c0_g1~~TRINITY_DN45263_c0_g1_i1.p2  ORF type:complete len:125 (+),score=0.60 TRINITY_DN45263_c0_g1_i1:207-581(+)